MTMQDRFNFFTGDDWFRAKLRQFTEFSLLGYNLFKKSEFATDIERYAGLYATCDSLVVLYIIVLFRIIIDN